MTLDALREKRQELRSEMVSWQDKVGADEYQWNAQDEENWDKLNEDYNSLEKRIQVLEATEKRIQEHDEPRYDSQPAPEKRSSQRRPGPQRATYDQENLAFRSWLKCQARMPLAEAEVRSLAHFGMDQNTAAYGSLQFRLSSNPMEFRRGMEYRGPAEQTLTENAELVPTEIARRVERAQILIGNVRANATVIRTAGGNPLQVPTSNDTANSVSIFGEDTDMRATDPAAVPTSNIQLDAFKYSTQPVLLTREVIDDSIVDMISFVFDALGERMARGQNAHFTTGTGTGQPNGIVTAATVFDIGASSGGIQSDDIIDLVHSVDPVYRRNGAFMMHDSAVADIRKLKETTNQYIWQPGLQAGQPDRLLGYTININQDMDASPWAAGEEALLFGELSKYWIRDVGTVEVRVLRELYTVSQDSIGLMLILRSDGELLDAGTNPIKAGQFST